MMTSEFSDQERQVLAAVERFVAREVRPRVAALERDHVFPEELVAQMKELGLYGLVVPPEYGGVGLRLPIFAAVLEALAAGWTTLAAYLNSHATVAYVIASHGTQAQKDRYLPGMATGAERAALCLTEPDAGSDLQSIRTSSVREGDSWRLRGTKIFVTNGATASLYLTLCRSGDEGDGRGTPLSLFLVERRVAGLSVPRSFSKMAFGLVDTTEVHIDDVTVPAELGLLGGTLGRGMNQLLDGLELGRIAIAASAVGLAAAALADATRYAGERKAFGVTIDHHQGVQLRLADMATKLVAARTLTQEAARHKQTGARTDMLSAMAKLYASEACAEIVQDALRIHGGYGYIRDFAIERLYREAPLYLVGEGTNDINRLVIARRMRDGEGTATLGLPA